MKKNLVSSSVLALSAALVVAAPTAAFAQSPQTGAAPAGAPPPAAAVTGSTLRVVNLRNVSQVRDSSAHAGTTVLTSRGMAVTAKGRVVIASTVDLGESYLVSWFLSLLFGAAGVEVDTLGEDDYSYDEPQLVPRGVVADGAEGLIVFGSRPSLDQGEHPPVAAAAPSDVQWTVQRRDREGWKLWEEPLAARDFEPMQAVLGPEAGAAQAYVYLAGLRGRTPCIIRLAIAGQDDGQFDEGFGTDGFVCRAGTHSPTADQANATPEGELYPFEVPGYLTLLARADAEPVLVMAGMRFEPFAAVPSAAVPVKKWTPTERVAYFTRRIWFSVANASGEPVSSTPAESNKTPFGEPPLTHDVFYQLLPDQEAINQVPDQAGYLRTIDDAIRTRTAATSFFAAVRPRAAAGGEDYWFLAEANEFKRTTLVNLRAPIDAPTAVEQRVVLLDSASSSTH